MPFGKNRFGVDGWYGTVVRGEESHLLRIVFHGRKSSRQAAPVGNRGEGWVPKRRRGLSLKKRDKAIADLSFLLPPLFDNFCIQGIEHFGMNLYVKPSQEGSIVAF
jgi:hypothetical protein